MVGYENTYIYNDYGELIRENNDKNNKTILYSYNDIGNIIKVQEYNYTTGKVGSLIKENTYTYDSSYLDRLIKYNNNSITYDDNGCLKTYNGWTYVWNKGKLAVIKKSTSTTRAVSRSEDYKFQYDAQGRRIEKKYSFFPGLIQTKDYLISKTSSYNYDSQGRLVNEIIVLNYSDNTTIKKKLEFIYEESQIIGVTYTTTDNSVTYYYEKNIYNDVIGIIDNAGETVVKYGYDAYGNCKIDYTINSDLAHTNPIRYRSYYYDDETNLYYLNTRYYSPEFCRFISPDSIEYLDIETVNGLNLYCYCGNDPINKYDPSGHSAILIGMLIGFGVGALIGGGFEIAKQAYNGGDWNWDMSSWNWGQIGLSALGGAVAGAISSISFGSGVVGYLTTFATGGIGSVLGGMISGSVTDFQSGLIAFGVGAVANVAARGITALINKGVSAGAQKALNNPIFDDMTLGDLVGSGLKNNGYAPAYNKFLNYAGNLVLKANGQWARSSMYSFANAGISSLLSGWY